MKNVTPSVYRIKKWRFSNAFDVVSFKLQQLKIILLSLHSKK
jgi:hypothetical protein